jgi:hypothetical protein
LSQNRSSNTDVRTSRAVAQFGQATAGADKTELTLAHALDAGRCRSTKRIRRINLGVRAMRRKRTPIIFRASFEHLSTAMAASPVADCNIEALSSAFALVSGSHAMRGVRACDD